jgi:membrane protein YqaA with SNARE-associated domain
LRQARLFRGRAAAAEAAIPLPQPAWHQRGSWAFFSASDPCERLHSFSGYINVNRITFKETADRAPPLGGANWTSASRLSLLFAAFVLLAITLSAIISGAAIPFVGLFWTSLIAGTFLPFVPGSSEMAMAGLIALEAGPMMALIATAILANTLGATANYLAGRHIARFADNRWFPITPDGLKKTTAWFQHYGIWIILLCFVPTFGDAITVVAGLLRADFRVFLMLAAIGKSIGHIAVAGGVGWFI